MFKEFRRVFLEPTEGGAGDDVHEGEDPTVSAPTSGEGEQPPQPQEETISKAMYDKLASEYAKYKRDTKAKERANMNEQELKDAEAEDTRKELEALRKETTKSKAISKLSKIQGNEEAIESIAQGLVEGDIEGTVESILKLVEGATSEANKQLETMKLEATQRPNVGDNSQNQPTTIEEYKKMTIDERIRLKASNPELYETLSKQNHR